MTTRTITTTALRWTPCPACTGSGEHQPGPDPQVVHICRRCLGRSEVLLSSIDDTEITAHRCNPDEHCDLCCLHTLNVQRHMLARLEQVNPAGENAARIRWAINRIERGCCRECPCGCGAADAWKGLAA